MKVFIDDLHIVAVDCTEGHSQIRVPFPALLRRDGKLAVLRHCELVFLSAESDSFQRQFKEKS